MISGVQVGLREENEGRGSFLRTFQRLIGFSFKPFEGCASRGKCRFAGIPCFLLFSQLIITPRFTRNWGPAAPKLRSQLVLRGGWFLGSFRSAPPAQRSEEELPFRADPGEPGRALLKPPQLPGNSCLERACNRPQVQELKPEVRSPVFGAPLILLKLILRSASC